MGAVDALQAEAKFRSLLADAVDLPELLRQLAAEGKPPMVGGDDVPDSTLLMLDAWAAVEYRGALWLLSEARVANAAEVLLRSLLEYYAHVAWIHEGHGGGGGKTPKGRALCLELGIGKEAHTTLSQKLKSWGQPNPIADAAAKQRYDDVKSLHDAEGCKCDGRGYGGVQPTLKALEKAGETWAFGLWTVSSSAAHQYLPARIMRDVGGGVTEIVDVAHYAWRGDLLGHSVRAYGIAGTRLLDMVNPGNTDRFVSAVNAILNGPAMTAATDGSLDREAIAEMDQVIAEVRAQGAREAGGAAGPTSLE